MIHGKKRFYYFSIGLGLLCLLFNGQIATIQQAENVSQLLVLAPAAGVQMQPQVAKGLTMSLAVWTDKRTVIGRYVPTDDSGIGSESDIYAARLDADGNLIDTIPIVVSQARYDQIYPTVAWNGQNWLVAWVTERLSNQYFGDVVAVRVAPDGTVLDGTPIPIGISQDASNPPNFVSATSDGTNWIVAWGGGFYGSSIVGARIAPNGTLIDAGGNGKTMYPDTGFTAPSGAQFAFANGQFLMTWAHIAAGGYGISAQRFDTTLDPIGNVFRVNQFAGSTASRSSVATDGTNFFVTWKDERYTFSEVFATRISAAGQVLDPNGIKIFGSLTEDMPFDGNVAVAWDGARYAVGYPGRINSGADGVLASYVTTEAAVSAPFQIAQTPDSRSLIVESRPNDGVTFIWVDRRMSPDGDIFGVSVAANGTVGADAAISLGAPRQTQPHFTKTEAGNLAFVYRSTISGESSVYLQRLDANGIPVGANPALVVSGPENLINPSVAWNGSVFLVVWELNTQVLARLVGADGTPIGAAFTVMPGNDPDVAALGSQFLVVDNYEPTNHIRFTQATKVDGSGTVIGSPVRIGSNYDLRPHVEAFGARWLVVWEANISHDNSNSSIAGSLVNADGTIFRGFSISGSSADAPDVAVSDNTALIVWQKSGNIYGLRINAAGDPLDGSEFLIADGPKPHYASAASWDGNRFIVSYSDSRNSDMEPPADIWAALVNLDGSVITAGGFPVADSPLPEEMSAVVSANGTTLFGYAIFKDRAPFAAFQIGLRRFPFDRDYFVSATPAARTIPVGGVANFSVSVNALNNFAGEVSLSVSGLPGGANAVFTPPVTTGTGTSVLQISTYATTPQGIHSLSIIGTHGAQQSRAIVSLVIDNDPSPISLSVSDLGTLGGTGSEARAINNNGQVVGIALNASNKKRAFLFSNGQMQDLGTFGGTESEAYDINDAGLVVGQARNPQNRDRAFLFSGDSMLDLGTLGGSSSGAFGINNSGQITGWANINTENYHAFLYSNGAMQDLGILNGYWSVGSDINTAGKIVGTGYVDGPGGSRVFIYSNGVMTPLGTLGGSDSNGYAINDNDQLTGNSSYLPTWTTPHGFLFSNGIMYDLGTFGGPSSYSYGINNAGTVVGTADLLSGAPRAFLYDGSQLRNLNSLIPAGTGWTLLEARDINEQGQIVGKGTINNQDRAFLLTPVGPINTPPTVQITSPVPQSRFTEPAVTINAAATDPDGIIVRVEFFADGALLGSQQSVPYAFLWTGMAQNRTYSLTAKAFDDRGASTISAPVSITIGTASARTKFDFDGDGKADVSVYRDGTWHLQRSTNGYSAIQFGIATDKIVPADYDGDGKTDVAVYRDGTWYIFRSSDAQVSILKFGLAGDIPQAGDYDGDSKADMAVFRPSDRTWYLQQSQNGFSTMQFGLPADKPVAADYDGDGKTDIAVYREGAWYLQQSRDGFTTFQFGISTDRPVPADYDGDAKTDIAVYRDGTWYVQRSRDGLLITQFGLANDKPVPADYDGDGKADIAVYRDGTWHLVRSTSGYLAQQFGLPNDVPVPWSILP